MVDLFGSSGTDTFSGNVGDDTLSTSSDSGFSLDWLPSVASAVVEGATSVISNKVTNDQASDSAQQFEQDAQASADIIKGGYDEQLAALQAGAEQLSRLTGMSFDEAKQVMQQAGVQYGDTLNQGTSEFAEFMSPQQEAYAQGLQGSDIGYRFDLGRMEDQAGGYLQDASGQFQDFYDPYVTAGDEALGYMREAASIDPSMLNLSQQRTMDDYNDQLMATLAASGLRGAGKAGVAAVNDGRASMMARLYDQNQQRKDAAMRSLLDRGYSATGQAAGNIQGLGNSLADMRYKVGSEQAANTRNTGERVAGSQYDLASDIGRQITTNTGKIADRDYGTAETIANLTGQYYGNQGNIASSIYGAYGDTSVAKSAADAAAVSASATNTANTNNANATRTGNTIGEIGSIINQTVKDNIPKPGQENKQTERANA